VVEAASFGVCGKLVAGKIIRKDFRELRDLPILRDLVDG